MLRFHELAPSPNNLKVRLALRFKNIPFEVDPVDPMDRSDLLELTGQVLSPAIEDKGIVLHDSEAIMHYLDANYPETPRLYPSTREGRSACDAWKQTLDNEVARPWAPVFFYGLGVREVMDEQAPGRFRNALSWLEKELGERESFGEGDSPVMDLRAAVWCSYAFPPEALVQRAPLFGRMKQLFAAKPAAFPRLTSALSEWFERLP